MPDAPAVACRCGKLNCQEHSAKANAKKFDQYRGSAASRGYGYNWSKRIQPMVLSRYPLCCDPFRLGCVQKSVIGDHIIPKFAGGTDSIEYNLQGLCVDCHNKKIAVERVISFVHMCSCKIKILAALLAQSKIILGCANHPVKSGVPVRQWTLLVMVGRGKIL